MNLGFTDLREDMNSGFAELRSDMNFRFNIAIGLLLTLIGFVATAVVFFLALLLRSS